MSSTSRFIPVTKKDKLVKEKVRTKMCNKRLVGKACHYSGCGFAHSLEELQPEMCSYGKSCKGYKGKPCTYVHPNENKAMYEKRTSLKWPLDIVLPPIVEVTPYEKAYRLGIMECQKFGGIDRRENEERLLKKIVIEEEKKIDALPTVRNKATLELSEEDENSDDEKDSEDDDDDGIRILVNNLDKMKILEEVAGAKITIEMLGDDFARIFPTLLNMKIPYSIK